MKYFCVPWLAKDLTTACVMTVETSYNDKHFRFKLKELFHQFYNRFNQQIGIAFTDSPLAILSTGIYYCPIKRGQEILEQNMSRTTVLTTRQRSVNIVWMKCAKYTKRGDGALTTQPKLSHYVSLEIKLIQKCGYY